VLGPDQAKIKRINTEIEEIEQSIENARSGE